MSTGTFTIRDLAETYRPPEIAAEQNLQNVTPDWFEKKREQEVLANNFHASNAKEPKPIESIPSPLDELHNNERVLSLKNLEALFSPPEGIENGGFLSSGFRRNI